MHVKQLVSRRAITAAVVFLAAAALALAYGKTYGSNNQLTYLLGPLHRVHPELYRRDWLVATTTAYHPVFTWIAAPMYALDPGGIAAFAIAQLVVMIATYALLYRLIAALAPRARLPMYLLLAGVLALGGGRAMAGSYLFAGYLQPSSLATLGWLAALLAWLRDRPLSAGVWLALAGVCHINFLLLGIGLFAAGELASGRVELRRLAAVLGPSLVVLAAFAPALFASAHAHEPDLALRILVKFHVPGHYDPARFRRWVPLHVAWLVVAWGALPLARAAGHPAVDRLWRFAAVATAVCVAATAIVSIPPWLGFTRLYVWRIAPFAQLASQLIVVAAALAPVAAATSSSRRTLAVVIGAAVVLVETIHLTHDHLTISAYGLLAAVGLAARWPRVRALALALAVATYGVALGNQRDTLVDSPLFDPKCVGGDCVLIDWVKTETPVDAVFLVPPYMSWFRLLGERAVVADTKSPPLYPDEIVEWYRRLCAMVDAPEMATHEAVEARWDTLAADQLVAAAHRFDVDYVLLYKGRSPARLTLPVAFENADYVVYRLR